MDARFFDVHRADDAGLKILKMPRVFHGERELLARQADFDLAPAGAFAAPLATTAGLFDAPLRDVAGLVQAIADQRAAA